MYNFNGKVALITGGTDGIGLAAAKSFVTAGAKVLVVGRNAERGQKALKELVALGGVGGDVRFQPVDVSEPEQVENMVASCIDMFGRLDFAVNNAAADFPLALTADIPLESVDRSLAVDLRGAWLCMKHEIDVMLRGGGGAQ